MINTIINKRDIVENLGVVNMIIENLKLQQL